VSEQMNNWMLMASIALFALSAGFIAGGLIAEDCPSCPKQGPEAPAERVVCVAMGKMPNGEWCVYQWAEPWVPMCSGPPEQILDKDYCSETCRDCD